MKKVALIFFISFTYITWAQETNNTTTPNPRPQPLDNTTIIQAWDLPSLKASSLPSAAASVSTAPGQAPKPSPEADNIIRFQDVSVNLYTGALNQSTPIYTLSEDGGATVPIILANNSSGMRAGEVAGWVGMNNTLIAGGQITRIPRGIPDEGLLQTTDYSNYTNAKRKGFYQHGLYADGDTENDSQPDVFLLTIHGDTYKFSFDANHKAHFYPEADIAVQVTWTDRNTAVPTGVGYFSNWIVTMSDGTKYYFNGTNQEKTFEIEANEIYNRNDGSFNLLRNALDSRDAIVSAWYLDRIETAFGHNTNFFYYPTQYSFYRLNEHTATSDNCTFTNAEKQINRVFAKSAVLYKIENTTKVLEINKDGWEQVSWNDGQGNTLYYWQNNNNYPARTDLDGFNNRLPSSSSKSRAVHKISVYAKDNPSDILNWNFGYEQVNSDDQNNAPPFGYTYAKVGYTHQRRFKLKTLTEPNGNSYTYSYYDDGFTLPSRFTMGIDHWGFLNGALGNTLLIGEDAFRVCANSQFANKTATSGWSQYGTLKKITHSTGTEVEFVFENHDADNYKNSSNQNITIGGNRVQKIINTDLISGLKTTKIYSYLTADGSASSGFLCLKPVYHFDPKENYSGIHDQYWSSGLYQSLLSDAGKPAVGYSNVKEMVYNDTETANIGYTISEFLQSPNIINIQETVGINCTTENVPYPPYIITTCESTNTYTRPWKWHPYNENNTGALKRQAVYNNLNELLSEKTTLFDEAYLRAPSNTQGNFRSFRWLDRNYNFESSYNEAFLTYRPVSETAKTYSTNGTNPITTITQFYYDESTTAKHNQLIKSTTTDALGNTITQEMKYAPDFEFSPGALGGDAPGIKALQDKHIWNIPILTTSSKTVGSDTFTTGASYLNFYDDNTADHQAGMAKSSYATIDMPNAAFSPFSYIGNTVLPSASFELKSTVSKYTAIGLPKETTANFGTTSIIGYHASYPTLAISGTSNNSQPSAQSSSTSYAKILFGSATSTAANGLNTTSEHYPDGQLKQVKDHNGHIIKHIQYVYRNQADIDPHVSTSTAYNRVITRMPRVTTTNALSLNYDQCTISIQYLDGSGRVLQSVAYKASPNLKDLVSGLTEYDAYSRPINSWPTVESDNADGSYYADASYKAKAIAFYGDQKPYTAIKTYEASPLSRVFESYAQGTAIQDNTKFAKAEYQTVTGIAKFSLPYNSNTVTIGSYATYEIIKSSSTDEKGETVEEYKDKTGKLLLKSVAGLTTAYIYDTADRLRYTLTPKGYANILAESSVANMEAWAHFGGQVYAYEYDGRGRTIRKHSPGTGWQSLVYNRMGQPLLSQDAHEAETNIWNYSKIDGQGRAVQTGQLIYAQSRDYIQSLFDGLSSAEQFEERGSAVKGYTNRSYPSQLSGLITDASLKTVAFFDNYSWAGALTYTGYPYTATQNTNATGMATGSLIKIDGQGATFYPATQYYDTKNRLIQSRNTHELGATNQSDVELNFAGEATKSQNIYRRSGAADIIIKKENILDHVGRPTDQYYEIVPRQARLLMSNYIYDNVGRIATKKIQPNLGSQASQNSTDWNNPATWNNNRVPSLNTATQINHTVTLQPGATAGSATLTLGTNGVLVLGANSTLTVANTNAGRAALQTINYRYTVKNQLLGINLDANGDPATSNEALFSYKLGYDYDNNISSNTWRTALDNKNRGFAYGYDAAKRLTTANYSGIGSEDYTTSQSYDANGNIETLSRSSKVGANYGIVDLLAYGYESSNNRLKTVDDTAPNQGAFTDEAGNNDYSYYADGKLLADANKGITSIEYNHLDLVKKITLTTGQLVEYEYTATGERRSKKVTGLGQNQYTQYDDEIQYTSTDGTNYSIAEIKNDEGRYVDNGLEYGYTDQLGNLRLSYKAGSNGAEISQAQSYDPWGNVLEGGQYTNSSNVDNYLITGKEYQKETGYTSLDWREYDSQIGRMHVPDPIDHDNISSYSFANNNPIITIDPSGMEGIIPKIVKGTITFGLGVATGGLAPIGFLPGLGFGTATGGGIGIINSAMNGTNVWKGAKSGALWGGAFGAINGGIGALKKGGNFWTGHVSPSEDILNLTEIKTFETAESLVPNDENLNKFAETNFRGAASKYSAKLQVANQGNLPKGYELDFETGIIRNIKGNYYVNGVTSHSAWGSSTITLSPERFTDITLLKSTVGHELIHAWHYSAKFLITANAGDYNNYTESIAHDFSRNININNKVNYLSANTLFNNYFSKLPSNLVGAFNRGYFHWKTNSIFSIHNLSIFK